MEPKPLDIRDITIIDSFPVYNSGNEVLNVGCGKGRIDFHLMKLGYQVFATDIAEYDTWENVTEKDRWVKFSVADIFNINSFPLKKAPVVICSEVLEHLSEYKTALANLLSLAEIRLIITVPWRKSFDVPKSLPPVGHCNYWDDVACEKYKNIHEFCSLCKPFAVSITKIRTKPKDVQMKQYGYLIVVDKRQKYNE